MTAIRFQRWACWSDRSRLLDLRQPGVYVLAISTENLAGRRFSWIRKIAYIGMTNSLFGLRGRLQQFDNTILGKKGHGGAERFRHKHQDYARLCKRLYITVAPFCCDVKSARPGDLRVMGRVAAFEYECFARYATRFGRLPEFNDKTRSPKSHRSMETRRRRSSLAAS